MQVPFREGWGANKHLQVQKSLQRNKKNINLFIPVLLSTQGQGFITNVVSLEASTCQTIKSTYTFQLKR